MPYYYLEMVRGSVVGQRYLLPDGAVSIGRSSQNTIALPPAEKSVSGHHAILYKSPERILVQDLQSTNGTFINEERIAERDFAPGEVLGFGKAGPRLKLVVSDQELDTSAPVGGGAFGDLTSIKTHEEPVPILVSKDATANEDKKTVSRLKQQRIDRSDDGEKSSVTIELEQKLIDKSIGQEDMRHLMKDGDRLEKIVKRGNLGETQAATLMSAYKAHRSMRRQWYYVVAAIIFVSAAISSFFGIRAFQYKHIVTKAKTIKRDLDEYEQRIAAAKSDPQKNREELEALIKQLEEKQKSLSSLKTRMNEDDFVEFYSDPLEKRIDEVLARFVRAGGCQSPTSHAI